MSLFYCVERDALDRMWEVRERQDDGTFRTILLTPSRERADTIAFRLNAQYRELVKRWQDTWSRLE